MSIKYPHINVELIGHDGNAVAMMMSVRRALQHAKVPNEEINAFLTEARSGDYDHVIETCCRWVDVS